MKKKFSLLCLLLLFGNSILAQDSAVILVTPVTSSRTHFGSSIKHIAKNNAITTDSLLHFFNATLLQVLQNRLSANCTFIDDTIFMKHFTDSVQFKLQFTTIHLQKIDSLTGMKKLQALNENSRQSTSYANIILPSAKAIGVLQMEKHQASFLIAINKIYFGTTSRFLSNQKELFIHFEIYDRNFNQTYAGKLTYHLNLSNRMYLSALYFILKRNLEYFGIAISQIFESSFKK